MRLRNLKAWIGAIGILIAGCQKKFEPSNTSGYSVAQGEADAATWSEAVPGRQWKHVSATGSMKPFLNENCIVLLEPYSGEQIPNGQAVLFDRGDLVNVLHVVVEQQEDSVYISGYNNHESDGWFPRSKISFLLSGIIFTKPE